MVRLNFDLKGYEKKLNYIFENLTKICMKLINSKEKEDIILGSEFLLEIAEILEHIGKVKNKMDLYLIYEQAENRIIAEIEKLTGAANKQNQNLSEDLKLFNGKNINAKSKFINKNQIDISHSINSMNNNLPITEEPEME